MTGTAPKIPDLDQWLLKVVEGLPREPRQYEFRCHPDVYAAIRRAEPPPEYPPAAAPSPAYGNAHIIVTPGLGSGRWELYEDGALLKSGNISELPAYVQLDAHGMHKHGTSEPGWVQHSHLGGGFPHEHDPETGFQVPLKLSSRRAGGTTRPRRTDEGAALPASCSCHLFPRAMDYPASAGTFGEDQARLMLNQLNPRIQVAGKIDPYPLLGLVQG